MRWLADLILIVHLAFVLFVTGGLLFIWIGAAAGWHWVHNFGFRVAHLAAICVVALEALIGVACPLTMWEDALRGTHPGGGFIERWLRRVLFYSYPEWIFTCAYVIFALLVAATWWRVRPQRRQSK